MTYIDEYRSGTLARRLPQEMERLSDRQLRWDDWTMLAMLAGEQLPRSC
jgi:hypothetical protein